MKIRKILSLVLVTLLVAGVAFAATPGFRLSPGIGEIPIQGGTQSSPGKIFRMVRYVPTSGGLNNTTVSANSLVVWDVISDDGVTVTLSTTSGATAVAGILAQQCLTPATLGNTAAVDRGKRNWTWLQTHGLAAVDLATDSAIGAGSAFGTSLERGIGTGWPGIGATLGPTNVGKAGFVYDAVTAGGTDVEVFLTLE